MAVLGSLCLLAAIVSSSSANMGYGSVGVLSGASASSDSGYGGQARAINTNYGGNVVNSAPVYTVQTSDDSDELVQTNNNNNNYGSSNGASASAYSSNGGNFLVRSGDIGNGVQVVQVDSAPAQNIGFQIQSTVQDILRRFGITMQNNVAGISGLYQPGRSFVVQSNGSPRILTNANMYGLGNVAQSQSQSQYMGDVQQSQQQGMNGLAYSLSTPVVVSYKVIAAPQVAPSLAFGISSQANQGGADVLARASSSSFRAGLSNGDDNVQTYAVQPPLNSNSYSNAAAASAAVASNQDQDDSSDDSYAPAPAPVKTKVHSTYGNSGTSAAYIAPTAPAPSRNRVRYIAQKNKKYESNSNVAYEEDSS